MTPLNITPNEHRSRAVAETDESNISRYSREISLRSRCASRQRVPNAESQRGPVSELLFIIPEELFTKEIQRNASQVDGGRSHVYRNVRKLSLNAQALRFRPICWKAARTSWLHNAHGGRNLWIGDIHGSACAIYGSILCAEIHGLRRYLWIAQGSAASG